MLKRLLCCLMLMLLPALALGDTVQWPAAVTVIGEETFLEDIGLDTVVVPDTVTAIGSRAFAYSTLSQITLPAELDIAEDAFEGCGTVRVITPSGSATAAFAKAMLRLTEYTYDAGTYHVGTDMPANVYIIQARGGKTATVTLSGGSLSLTRSFTGNLILRVQEGETLVMRNATAIVDYEFDQHEKLDFSGSQGMLRVGTDIPEGSYYLKPTGTSGTLTWYADDRFTVSNSLQIDAAWLAEHGTVELTAGQLIGYEGLRVPAGDGTVVRRALLIAQTYAGANEINLEGTVPDAQSMSAMLRSLDGTPFSCTVMTDVSASGILSAVKSVFADADGDDVSLFFYSGHGYTGGRLEGYDLNFVTPAQLRAAMDTVSGEKVLLLDCCYSGGMLGKSGWRLMASADGVPAASSADADTAAFVAAFNSAFGGSLSYNGSEYFDEEPYYVITACAADEVSYERHFDAYDRTVGMFSYYLLEGCGWNALTNTSAGSAKADDGDGMLTLKELYTYAHGKVAALDTPTAQTVSCYPVGSGHVLFIP